MKKYRYIVLVLLFGVHSAFAQDWHTDFSEAKEIAKEAKLPIVLVFQGSDWCAPCIKLDREVWSTDEFSTYAENHFVMLQADFPRRKGNALPAEQTKKNKMLAETYNPRGIFPLVVVMDYKGKVLGETSYKKVGPKEYIKELNAFTK